jgi:hypothetical protein
MIGGLKSSGIETGRVMELSCLTRPSKQRHSLHKVVGEEAIVVEGVDMLVLEVVDLQVEIVGSQEEAVMLVVEMVDVILDIQMEVHLDAGEDEFFLLESSYFCYLGGHAQFQIPTICPYWGLATSATRRRKRKICKIVAYGCQTPSAQRHSDQ